MFDENVVLTAEALTIFAAMLTAVIGALAMLFRMLIAAKDRELTAAQAQTEQYRALARRALLSLERAWREQRAAAGLPPVALPVPDPNLAPEDLGARMDAVAAALAHGGPDV